MPANRKWLSLSVWVDREAFKRSAYVWFVASTMFFFLGFHVVFFNLEEWAAIKGFGKKGSIAAHPEKPSFEAGKNGPSEIKENALDTWLILGIMNVTGIIGRCASGFVADKVGALRVAAITGFLMFALTLLWIFSFDLASAYSFACLFGAASGAGIGILPACITQMLDRTPERKERRAQWIGMLFSAAAIPALTGPLIAGYLLEEYDNYLTIQIWSGSCFFCSAFCAFVASRQDRKFGEAQRLSTEPPSSIDEAAKLSCQRSYA